MSRKLTCFPLINNHFTVSKGHKDFVVEVPFQSRQNRVCNFGFKRSKADATESNISMCDLQDAQDGSWVLHLHAVFPVPDVVWGLVNMDAGNSQNTKPDMKDGFILYLTLQSCTLILMAEYLNIYLVKSICITWQIPPKYITEKKKSQETFSY